MYFRDKNLFSKLSLLNYVPFPEDYNFILSKTIKLFYYG